MKKQILSLGLSLLLMAEALSLPAAVFAETAGVQAPPAEAQQESTLSPEEAGEPQAQQTYTHQISDAGLELIKSFEGYSRYAYWDYKQYSIGYGSYVESPDTYPDGITEREASELLRTMVNNFIVKLNEFLETNQIALNQNQFDALASFTYNLGKYVWTARDYEFIGMLKRGEHITNKEAFIEAYCEICHAGGQFLQGLYDRRMREMNVFYSPYTLSDPDTDLYVVNVDDKLIVRKEPSKSAARVGSIQAAKVIRIHEYSADGKWGYTSYCGYFGWVSTDYLVGIGEEEMVSVTDARGIDENGVQYTFDSMNMTATAGGAGVTNSSGYAGAYGGQLFLTKYVLHDGAVYKLTGISSTAFTGCQTLSSIYIPPSVTTVGDGAFADSSLREIVYTDGSFAKTYAHSSPYTATDERCIAGHTHSAWKVTVKASSTAAQVEERTCSVCKCTQSRRHTGIEIVTYPNKTEYKEGIAFSQTGLSMRVRYSDGSATAITDFKVSGYNKNKIGKQTLTVTYSVFKTTFEVQVAAKSLTKITITAQPKKVAYIEGQELELAGLAVRAHYDNNTTANATGYKISGYDKNKIGKQTITVTYNGKSTTFTVTVREKSLTAIQIVDYPATMEYFCNQPLKTDGLRLRLSYDNGTQEYINRGYLVSGYDNSQPGVQTVSILYGGKVQTMQITVILNYLKSDYLQVGTDLLLGLPTGATASELKSYFHSGDRVEVLKNGRIMGETDLVTTGCTIRLMYNGTVQDSATVCVRGDLTGDGRATVSDFVMLGDYLMGNFELGLLSMNAADLDGDSKITLADYCALYPLTLADFPMAPV